MKNPELYHKTVERFYVLLVGRKIQNGEVISGDNITTVDQPSLYLAKRMGLKLSRGEYEMTRIHECHVYAEKDGDVIAHYIYKEGKQTHKQF